MKEADLMKLLTEARQHLGKREDLDNGKDVTSPCTRMLGKLDAHTDYIDPETVRSSHARRPAAHVRRHRRADPQERRARTAAGRHADQRAARPTRPEI